jgi:hypothetical protein
VYPNIERQFGASFIEEGICEYINQNFGECPAFINIRPPMFRKEFTNINRIDDIKYKYSSAYVKDFFDLCLKLDGKIKFGLMILLQNPPPNYEEIINPKLYFDRLKLGLVPETNR